MLSHDRAQYTSTYFRKNGCYFEIAFSTVGLALRHVLFRVRSWLLCWIQIVVAEGGIFLTSTSSRRQLETFRLSPALWVICLLSGLLQTRTKRQGNNTKCAKIVRRYLIIWDGMWVRPMVLVTVKIKLEWKGVVFLPVKLSAVKYYSLREREVYNV